MGIPSAAGIRHPPYGSSVSYLVHFQTLMPGFILLSLLYYKSNVFELRGGNLSPNFHLNETMKCRELLRRSWVKCQGHCTLRWIHTLLVNAFFAGMLLACVCVCVFICVCVHGDECDAFKRSKFAVRAGICTVLDRNVIDKLIYYVCIKCGPNM